MRELSLGDQKKVMVAMELMGGGPARRLHFRDLFEHLDLLTQTRLERLFIALQMSQQNHRDLNISIPSEKNLTRLNILIGSSERNHRVKRRTQITIRFNENCSHELREQILGRVAPDWAEYEVERKGRVWTIGYKESNRLRPVGQLLGKVKEIEKEETRGVGLIKIKQTPIVEWPGEEEDSETIPLS